MRAAKPLSSRFISSLQEDTQTAAADRNIKAYAERSAAATTPERKPKAGKASAPAPAETGETAESSAAETGETAESSATEAGETAVSVPEAVVSAARAVAVAAYAGVAAVEASITPETHCYHPLVNYICRHAYKCLYGVPLSFKRRLKS